MATYAKQVEQYELNCPLYQNKPDQKARNTKVAEECMHGVSFVAKTQSDDFLFKVAKKSGFQLGVEKPKPKNPLNYQLD